MGHRFRYSVLFALTGLIVPFLWLAWRAFSTRRAWWLAWMEAEWKRNSGTYLCLGISAVCLFAILGFVIGRMRDDLRSQSEEVEGENQELAELAARDGLTGLFNARYIHERLEIDMEEAVQAPLSCLLVDIDHFKKINDTHGHPCGDRVLVAVAQTLRSTVRRMDAVGRLGGEEFIILLPGAPKDRAARVAQQVRADVQSQVIPFDDKDIRVTVSVGVVSYPAPGLKNKTDLLAAADEALYAAKRGGRNRVVVWNPSKSRRAAA